MKDLLGLNLRGRIWKHRIEQRTKFDLEMLQELGSCKGVENYSRHFDGREIGERPYCLLDFFATNADSFHGGRMMSGNHG